MSCIANSIQDIHADHFICVCNFVAIMVSCKSTIRQILGSIPRPGTAENNLLDCVSIQTYRQPVERRQASRIGEQGRQSTTVEEVSRADTFCSKLFAPKILNPIFADSNPPPNDVPFYTACCLSIIGNFAVVPLRKSFLRNCLPTCWMEEEQRHSLQQQ